MNLKSSSGVNLKSLLVKPNNTAELGNVICSGCWACILFIQSTASCPSFRANDLSNGLGTPPVAMLPIIKCLIKT